MVSSICVYSSNKHSSSFSGKNLDTKPSPAEKFINDVNNVVKTQEKGNFISKYFWSQTAMLVGALPILGYEFFYAANLIKLAKTNPEAGNAYMKKFLKTSPIVFAAGATVFACFEYLFSRNSDKKTAQFQQDFLDINKNTEARLRNQLIRSSYMGALCSPIGEEISFNKNLILDPISRHKLKKLVKHELVHAKQYETIARSENGIKKLNYAVLCSVAKSMNTPTTKKEIENIYQDIMNDATGKFDNINLHITGADVDLKKYIEGIHTILTNKNTGTEDVPIVIDEEHYKNIIETKGALTKKEEEKASEYYQAMLNYPPTNLWNIINPFSDYYNNLLEREAYKESPNFITFIRHLFVKD